MSGLANDFKDLMVKKDNNDNLETVNLLLKTDKDLNSKTEIYEPFELSYLKAVSDLLKDKGLKDSSNFIESLVKEYKTLMISKDRKGRQEVIEIFKQLKDQELGATAQKSFWQKLIGGGKNNDSIS